MAELITPRLHSRLGLRHLLTFVLLAVLVPVGALIATFPMLGLALIGAPFLAGVAWPRWVQRDIEYFAGGVFIESSLLGLASQVDLGPYTLGGVVTVVEVVVAFFMLVGDSRYANIGASWLWPLIGFFLWSSISLLISPFSLQGFQNIVVYAAFIAITLVAAMRSRAEEALPGRIERLFERMYWLLAALEGASIVLQGPGAGFLLSARGSARSFALLALLAVASGLSRWRYGERKLGAAMSVSAILLIALSLSRAAFVTACLLIPLAWFRPKSIAASLRMVALVGSAFAVIWAAVVFIEPLHERFFPDTGDFVSVGGYQLNVNGRTDLWGATWDHFEQSPWFGNGAGASAALVLPLGVGHPHNDYLRLLDDYGLVGTGLWAIGIVIILARLIRVWIRADASGDPRARFYLWAILGTLAILATMITDNVLVYLHVMGPLGFILGMAIGRADEARISAQLPDRDRFR